MKLHQVIEPLERVDEQRVSSAAECRLRILTSVKWPTDRELRVGSQCSRLSSSSSRNESRFYRLSPRS